MPGVPSYRGCDACRKQKKKCDQAKPLCSRCSRLGIECIGNGQQRYKFKDQTVVFASTGKVKTTTQTDARLVRRHGPVVVVPSQPLTNDLTALTSSFISMLEVKDPRYDLYCYGNFLHQLPSRLGKNAALDAAVGVVTSGFTCVRTHAPSPEALSRYVVALKALRGCLADPATMTTPETLTAVYLIMVCQGWLGGDGMKYLGHGQAMSHILGAASSQSWTGEFEKKLIVTMSTVVIIESIFNDNISLDTWLPRLSALTGSLDNVQGAEGFDLMSLAEIPRLFRNPDEHIPRLLSAYNLLRTQCPQLRVTVEKLDEPNAVQDMIDAAGPVAGVYFSRIQTRAQTTYGLLLVSALIYNRYLREADPDDHSLVTDGVVFTQDIIELAKLSYPRLPFGASYIPLCLMTAWCVAEDAEQQLELQAQLVLYRFDLMNAVARDCVVWLSKAIKNGVKKMAQAKREGRCDSSTPSDRSGSTEYGPEAPPGGAESCCIL